MVGVYYVLDCYKGLYGRRRGSHIHTYTHTRTHARTAPEHHCQSGSVRDGQALCVSVLVCVCVIHAVCGRRGSHIHTPTHSHAQRLTINHCRSGVGQGGCHSWCLAGHPIRSCGAAVVRLCAPGRSDSQVCHSMPQHIPIVLPCLVSRLTMHVLALYEMICVLYYLLECINIYEMQPHMQGYYPSKDGGAINIPVYRLIFK